ncbi:ABC transporter permease subunit [Vibrio sp. S9_S30]|uniref:ABC transporter permease subunit n=1 Tax=Vibrio sp. S9_S30 TaxID=2720226 RepID=UPI0016813700|nr:ABC transporter permease subunit [Vibrio sp. S9_S30]MBD1555747.1 ABC transporter permease subunit [Vibrio sp. S9_S30]
MLHTEFSLKERDRKRLIKDRLMRCVVKVGGVSVLIALLLIFFYLLLMVLPVFSSANIERVSSIPVSFSNTSILTSNKPIAAGVDDYGQLGYFLTDAGELAFIDLTDGRLVQSQPISTNVLSYAGMPASLGWHAFVSGKEGINAVKPSFSVQFNAQGRVITPRVNVANYEIPADFASEIQVVSKFAFAITDESATFAVLNDRNQLFSWRESDGESFNSAVLGPMENVVDIKMSPDGRQLFLLTPQEIIVMAWIPEKGFSVREMLDATRGEDKRALSMSLLAGAQSVLIRYTDNTVAQWFDVLKDRIRTLTFIRDFALSGTAELLLPEYYRKGFYAFDSKGTVENFYTTSEEKTFSARLLQEGVQIAAVSSNEDSLLVMGENRIDVYSVDNEYPEISFSALWQSVWYEGYPAPQYVWQSTSGSDDFEAKFSLAPIAFGTLKAALFAMIFAVPIAVLGAIYTAYFMSTPMRKVVKPAIEIMEALPTVIIGFLAGLWLAPVIESHLPSTLALIILLPLSTILVGWLWHQLPSKWLSEVPNGLHGLILVPTLLLVTFGIVSFSHEIERFLFGGDVRVYLASIGIDYDQRNALVVGLAMGFAVIPTIFTIAEDAIFSVPKHLSDGSLALGATKWQTLVYVVLLTASPGIFSAVMMGLGRAVGETMIVLMATGNTPIMDWNIFEGMRSLSATIAIEMPESDVGSSHYRLLFLAALILFVFTFFVNSLAEWVRQRLRDKYRAL